jgi:hypothetical protein
MVSANRTESKTALRHSSRFTLRKRMQGGAKTRQLFEDLRSRDKPKNRRG